VIIGPFLFDGLARPGPFFDGPRMGRVKTGRAGPFATPSLSISIDINIYSINIIIIIIIIIIKKRYYT